MKRCWTTLLIVLSLSAHSAAQTTAGTVTGIVTDAGGAAVPEASVKLASEATGFSQTTVTDAEGAYVFPLVSPGAYQITIERQGFQRFIRTFSLEVAQQARIDAQLTIGQVSESVSVSAAAVLLEATSSNLGQVVTNRQVTELPLNGRNPFALAALTPGVTPLASFGAGLTAARGAAQTAGVNNFTSNGGMTGANEILLDGIPITVCCQGQPALIPTIDTTEEFKVQTNTSPAEFGRTSGGILNILTKSGTNQFHGSAYEFFRNEKLDAANFFVNRAGTNPIPGRSDRRTPLRYNQYGAAAGGPVSISETVQRQRQDIFLRQLRDHESEAVAFPDVQRADGCDAHRRPQRSRVRYLRPRHHHAGPCGSRPLYADCISRPRNSAKPHPAGGTKYSATLPAATAPGYR